MKAKIRIGIVGCGTMGRIHAEAFSTEPNCELAGFQNRTASRARVLADEFGGRFYASFEEMVADPGIDAFCIASSQAVHAEQVMAALRAGKDVFCEKPLALTVPELDALEKVARRSRRVVMVGHQLRFHPVIRKVVSTLPKIGAAFHLDLEMTFLIAGASGRCWEDYRSGGFFMELGCHLTDLSRFLMGEVRDVSARTLRLNPKRVTEDHTHCLLQFENHAIGTISVSANYRVGRQGLLRGRVLGEKGRLEFVINPYGRTFNNVTLTLDSGRDTFRPDGPGKRLPLQLPRSVCKTFPGFFDVYQRQASGFLKAVQTRSEPPVKLSDGRAAVEIILAAYNSQGLATDGPNFSTRKWRERTDGACHPLLQSSFRK